MTAELWALVPLTAIIGFFGTVWYGFYLISRGITGKLYRAKELEALRQEVAQLRQEFASHLYGQDSEIQRLGERLRSVEHALPGARAGAQEDGSRFRVQGSKLGTNDPSLPQL